MANCKRNHNVYLFQSSVREREKECPLKSQQEKEKKWSDRSKCDVSLVLCVHISNCMVFDIVTDCRTCYFNVCVCVCKSAEHIRVCNVSARMISNAHMCEKVRIVSYDLM